MDNEGIRVLKVEKNVLMLSVSTSRAFESYILKNSNKPTDRNPTIEDVLTDAVFSLTNEFVDKNYPGRGILFGPIFSGITSSEEEMGILMEIHLYPELEIGSLDGLEIEVPDMVREVINAAIEKKRKDKLTLAKDKPAGVGDTVSYSADNGKKKTTRKVLIGRSAKDEILSQLIGKRTGDEFDVLQKGKKFHIVVKGVYVLPDLDDNFAKSQGYETMDELRKALYEGSKTKMDELQLDARRLFAMKAAAKAIKMDISNLTIDKIVKEIGGISKEYEKYNAYYGIFLSDRDQRRYTGNERDSIIMELKINQAAKQLMKEGRLKVTEEEIRREMSRLMFSTGESRIPDEEREIRQMAQEILSVEKFLDMILKSATVKIVPLESLIED